jgi:adenylyl-sulfate kinase
MNLNLTWHLGKVTPEDRFRLLGQSGLVVWFTGLSGSGKSTLAVEAEQKLFELGRLAYRLDGDNIRQGLNSDLGFTARDRDENIRRVAEVAALFQDAGLIVLVAFISPFKTMREFARQQCGENKFLEVFLKADLDTLKQRDVKGLYTKALKGSLPEFTGISHPYEEPHNPDLVINTATSSIDDSVEMLLSAIRSRQPW